MESPDGGCVSLPTGDGVLDNDSFPAGTSSSQFDDTGEPSTQPMVTDGENEEEDTFEDSQEGILSPPPGKKVFGYLIPMKPSGDRLIPIEADRFNVGRSLKNSHNVYNGGNDEESITVSKFHFEINHDSVSGVAFLVDKSSNGTYIDDRKVARNKREVLSHNSYVSMASAKNKNFVYLSSSKDYQRQHPAELRNRYIVSRELGKGACGTVYLGVRKEDHHRVAIKAINRKVVLPPTGAASNVLNEVRLLQAIDHPCVIRLEDVIETGNGMLYIILELAEGGELFDKIIEKSRLAEAEAKVYFYQLLSAIEYLHGKNICHRDLKPENVLLCSHDDANPVIKVTDLGLSKFVDVHTHLKTFCGTPQYLAPEVLYSRVRGDGSYDLKCDMWSLGVILYILLCGAPPFNPNNTDKPLIRQITEGDYSFPKKEWSKISPEAVDLVKKLMTVTPRSRLSAKDALRHTWMDDAVAVAKAQRLMGIQQTRAPTVLNGILPPELDNDDISAAAASTSSSSYAPPKPLLEEPGSSGGNGGHADKFKRPLLDDLPPSNKRVKV